MSIDHLLNAVVPLKENESEWTFDGEAYPIVRAVFVDEDALALEVVATNKPLPDFTGRELAVRMGPMVSRYLIADLMNVEFASDSDEEYGAIPQGLTLMYDYTFTGMTAEPVSEERK